MRQRRIIDAGPKRARVEPHALIVQLNRQPAEVARRAIQVVLLRLVIPNLDELACGAVDEVGQAVSLLCCKDSSEPFCFRRTDTA